jgi:hypothetical protein
LVSGGFLLIGWIHDVFLVFASLHPKLYAFVRSADSVRYDEAP